MTDHTNIWLERWMTKDTPWRLAEVNPALLRHSVRFLGSTPKKVFVPLCGDTMDMKWLVDNGNTIVGVELSDISVKGFFNGHNISYSVKDMTSVPGGKMYYSNDKKYLIYCCDMFALDPNQEPDFGTIDAVYDRGAFRSIEEEFRPKYMEFMKYCFKSKVKYLLETVDRGPSIDPPYFVCEDEIADSFGKNATIQKLERIEINKLSFYNDANFPAGISGFFVYLISIG